MGIYQAYPWAEIVGVDLAPQPRYPFTFVQADALDFPLGGFDAIFASPPCQRYSKTKSLHKDAAHPDLVALIRQRLRKADVPYVIENVVGAPLLNPIRLCGTMFELFIYRHRLFESNVPLVQPRHEKHSLSVAKLGKLSGPAQTQSFVGHFSNVTLARKVMGIDWMTRNELAQAIPPAYSRYVVRQLGLH